MPNQELAFKKRASARIENWSKAMGMINRYILHTGITIPGPGNTQLTGLRVDREHIEEILNQPDRNIDELFIQFAVRESGQYGETLTTVLTGIDSDGHQSTKRAIDYCDPCPNKCPQPDPTLTNPTD